LDKRVATGDKKYARRILLVTDAEANVNNLNDLDQVIQNCTNLDAKIEVM
jgi:hypothetical protein